VKYPFNLVSSEPWSGFVRRAFLTGSVLGSATSSRTSVDTGSQESFIYPRRVLVIRAGPRPRRRAPVLLNKRTAFTFEHVLSAFASAVCIESGCVKQLYGVTTGLQVCISTVQLGFKYLGF